METSALITAASTLWGFTPTRLVEAAERHVTFIAQNDQESLVFVKATMSAAQVPQIENEGKANIFLRQLLDGKKFFVPAPLGEVRSDGRVHALAFEFVRPRWLAAKFRLNASISDADLCDIAELIETLHANEERGVPKYFKDRAVREFNDDHLRQKQREYLVPVLAAGHIREADEQALVEIATGSLIPRRFVHHDIVPWNLGRNESGRLVVTDAEFARWGMAGYDVAYWFLQCYTFLGDSDLARRGLKTFMQRLAFTGAPSDPIWKPLAYRVSANLHIATTTNPDHLSRVMRILPHILKRDIDGLLRA